MTDDLRERLRDVLPLLARVVEDAIADRVKARRDEVARLFYPIDGARQLAVALEYRAKIIAATKEGC
jgi:hypothetical protein